MIEWKSLDDQLKELESLGMNIGDWDKAKEVLHRIGYFRLGGYSSLFRMMDKKGHLKNQFVEDTNLSEIYELYVFDKKLKLLCLDAIERIEIAIRAAVSQELGRIDQMAYMDLSNFDPLIANRSEYPGGKTEFKRWHERHNDFIEWKKKSKTRNFVKKHLNKNGMLPITVAVETFDFGRLSHLLMMMKEQQRDNIASSYNLRRGEDLSSWIISICKIRNISAHHERLWNTTIPRAAAYVSSDHGNIHINNIRRTSNKHVFHYLCTMQFLLLSIYPNSGWGVELRNHLLRFPTPKNLKVKIDQLGVVKGWHKWHLWDPYNKSPLQEAISPKGKLKHWLTGKPIQQNDTTQ